MSDSFSKVPVAVPYALARVLVGMSDDLFVRILGVVRARGGSVNGSCRVFRGLQHALPGQVARRLTFMFPEGLPTIDGQAPTIAQFVDADPNEFDAELLPFVVDMPAATPQEETVLEQVC